jgi:hypothetical protein
MDGTQPLVQAANENVPGLLAQRLVKGQQEHRLRAELLQGAQPVFRGLNERGCAVRRHNGCRMPVEGDHDRGGIVLLRISLCLADDLLMPEMYAIEEADRQAGFASRGGEFFSGSGDLHE